MTLTPEQLPVVRTLFEAALDLPPEQRENFLEAALPDDPNLRDEVASLLAAADRTPVDLSLPLGHQIALPAPPGRREMMGHMLGAYRVVREIGQGGMGTVYEAERADDQFTMRVAIKSVRTGTGSAEMVRRFQREREIQAGLQHPNIAAVMDAGATEDGVPYLVLEFVDGLPIDTYCDQRRLGLAARLDLFRQVIGAVHHAHRHLVVHRDLKPSNILVTGDGVVKLLDFGISKLVDDTADQTATEGARAFTTAYASPEQVRGAPVGTATDIYSLGVVLYRLLTGRNPIAIEQSTPAAAWMLICEQDPELPSRVALQSSAETMGLGTAAKLSRNLAGDLDAILLMALRKEPDRRYPTADALGEDLLRHLRGLPVLARPDSTNYRIRRLVMRNRLASAAVAAAVLALVGGTGISLWQARNARIQTAIAVAERATADQERRTALRVSEFLQDIFASADQSWAGGGLGPMATLADAVDSAAARVDTELADEPAVEESLHRILVMMYGARRLPEKGLQHARRLLELLTMRHASPQELARGLTDVGSQFYLAGHLDSSQIYLDRAYALFESEGFPDTADMALLLNELAIVAYEGGAAAAAEGYMTRGLEVRERVLPNDPVTAIGYGNLGTIRDALGNLNGAVEAHRRAEAIHTSGAFPENYERGTNLLNLSLLQLIDGHPEEAERLLHEAFAIWDGTIGRQHLLQAIGRFNLARVYNATGRHVEALGVIREGRAMMPSLPPENAHWARALWPEAVALLQIGRVTEAERSARGAVAIRKAAYPAGDWRLAEVEATLGQILAARGNRAEGVGILTQSRDAVLAAMGPDHPRTRAVESLLQQTTAQPPPDP